MNRMVIKELYLFEVRKKLAKKVIFNDGINIITSDEFEGNDVGKSIIMKSIYHTLGADSIFDDKWSEEPKTYIIHIDINDIRYYIYRNGNMFKIFNGEFEKKFSTINRKELAHYLKDLYNFCVKLPDRNEEELEVTPPVYSYLLNYVDQDHMNGSKFSSFLSLGQYSNYKENVLYNHFGVFTDEYFNTVKVIEKLRRIESKLLEEKSLVESMLERVRNYLDGLDAPANEETLKVELDRSKREYTKIIVGLKKAKNSITKLRNTKIELENDIEEVVKIKKAKEKDVSEINKNICPTCSQETEDIKLRVTENSRLEDFYIVKDQLDELLLEVSRKLLLKEEEYSKLLIKFEKFEEEIKINNNEIDDVLKHRGYIETQENMLIESAKLDNDININSEEKQREQKIINKYKALKKKANSLYKEYMTESILEFGLEEINEKSVRTVKNTLKARGSNIPITTIIWHFNLLKIKYHLNSNSIKFPIVLDSPNNVELDKNKRQSLFNYIFHNKDEETQLIISTLGFDEDDYEVTIDKIIGLNNKKYQLLNSKDYEENSGILENVLYE